MRRLHFLLSRRWLTIMLVAVVVMAACIFLGRWQFDRHEARAAANNLVTTNYDAAPVALESAVDLPGEVPADLVWQPVELTGEFVGGQVTLRNRPVEGTDSARVLAVMQVPTTDGDVAVVVDRGWLGGGAEPPPLPEGQVSLTARLRQAEPADSRTPPEGQVFRIDPATVLGATGVEASAVLDGYLLAVVPPAAAESGDAGTQLQQFPRPATDPGPHLSYAFQWWVFAVGAIVGVIILVRREAAENAGAPPPVRRRSPDAEAEDALVDAQLP